MTKIKIPLGKPYVGSDELEAIKNVMESGCAAGTCPEVRKFEDEFAEFIGSKYAVATSSCTTALHLACLAIGLSSKSTAVVPSFTFPATGFAPKFVGAEVDVVDVQPDTFNIDPECLPGYLPDVIIPVHCVGNPADMDAIMDYADDTGAAVIEDAACAIPAYYKGKPAGTIGTVGCYSFYAIKNLCTGEGGMLVTDNEEIAEKARSLCDFGKTTSKPLPKFTQLGYNYRLSAIQAAVGRVQLKKLTDMHERRTEIAKKYDSYIHSELGNLIKTQVVRDLCVSAYQRYTIVLNPETNRDKVIMDMDKLGIQCAIGTYDLASQPYFEKNMAYHRNNQVSKLLFEQSISLPTFPGLTQEEINTVCEALRICLCSNQR